MLNKEDDMKRKFVQDYKRKLGEDKFSYEGDYYIFHIEETEKKKRCAVQIIFVVVQMILIVAAGLLNSPGSYKAYIVLPYLCMILPLIYYMMGAVGFIRIPERMEKHQYEATIFRMMKSIVAVFFLCVFTVVADGVFLIRNKDTIDAVSEGIFLVVMVVLAIMDYAALIYHNKMYKSVVVEIQKQKDTK